VLLTVLAVEASKVTQISITER